MLILPQNGFRRIGSLLLSPHRVQRMQIRKSSALKRSDSLWKVGVLLSTSGGLENTVTLADKMGSGMHRWSCYQTFDPFTSFIRADSFALYLKQPFEWTSPSFDPDSILEFKKKMEQYGYANNMVLPLSNTLIQLGHPERFVSTTVHAIV